MSTTNVAVPGTVIPSGSLTSPAGGQGLQGLQGVAGESYPIGVIVPYTSTTAPPTWMICDGSAISRTTYPALFTICGTTFGAGDGSTTFNLPDLRGRVGVGAGQGTGLTNRALAAKGGEEAHQLVVAEMPSHTHDVYYQANAASGGVGTGVSGSGSHAGSATTPTGGDGAHNTMPPYVVVAYIIKVSSGGGATAQAPLADTTQSGLLRQVSGKVTDFVDGTNNVQPIGGSFLAKTAAYTLTVADSNKYVLCSGGSWTLTLPAPLIGLTYDLRNDMGISGTTGTITLQPTGGTIDGVASLALLPGQECKLRCDGTNWRTFGKQRVVVIGTLDITSSVASAQFLLPVGYRDFEIVFKDYIPVNNRDYLQGVLSTNGGTTWITTNYYEGLIFDNAATTVAYQASAAIAYITLNAIGNTVGPWGSLGVMKLSPGVSSPSINPSYLVYSEGYDSTNSRVRNYVNGGMLASGGIINALKVNALSGNITNLSVTVKGFV